ncbi:hypothetical protein BCR36DRAFT_328462 [Piromyces finnis]|uniref:Zn(2)-C6 fungal-type domain-containing protein n=1 Tax=Piromyces finnis TaxID=1754191 RepID=A0A1Y1V8V5_9FUNG|nr:hypothetical protein BCR36DRAFT_328462 [Piromyces finnis]|eukprot:ORX49344.1 hypothetical protein BCR36DRAFT_328462 [Piromyces finnis]
MDKKPITTTSVPSTVLASALAKKNSTIKPSTASLLTAAVSSTATVPQMPLVPLAKKKKTVAKRKKVSQACVYCRRSHMTCDVGRPCQRCIKRNIAHLCHDEPKTKKNKKKNGKDAKSTQNKTSTTTEGTKTPSVITTPTPTQSLPKINNTTTTTTTSPINPQYSNLYLQQGINPFYNMNFTSFNPIFSNDYVGSELNVISDFLATLEDPSFNTQLNQSATTSVNNIESTSPITAEDITNALLNNTVETPIKTENEISSSSNTNNANNFDAHESKTEQFILKAADPPHKTSAERLAAFLNAKYEAGLLKPFNHVNGYTRLYQYMEKNLSKANRQRIINVIEYFRPSFRAVAQSLTDIDLILVEEAFERLLLEYDRVFTSMGIPSCLWRRTGEIFKCNKEFADLINMSMDDFKEGKICIYELLAEESAVNYWEKYGNIAFDPGQKAVLTSCVLRNPKKPSQGVSCCFSFTIRRDKYNIPMMIVGNFLPA